MNTRGVDLQAAVVTQGPTGRASRWRGTSLDFCKAVSELLQSGCSLFWIWGLLGGPFLASQDGWKIVTDSFICHSLPLRCHVLLFVEHSTSGSPSFCLSFSLLSLPLVSSWLRRGSSGLFSCHICVRRVSSFSVCLRGQAGLACLKKAFRVSLGTLPKPMYLRSGVFHSRLRIWGFPGLSLSWYFLLTPSLVNFLKPKFFHFIVNSTVVF